MNYANWFDALKDKEKVVLERLKIPREDYYNKDLYDLGNWAVSLLNVLHEMIPLNQEKHGRLGIIRWFREGVSAGLLTPAEKQKLCHFCITMLSF